LDGVFVGAVLTPHDRKNAKFCEVWNAAKDVLDLIVFRREQAQFFRRVYRGQCK